MIKLKSILDEVVKRNGLRTKLFDRATLKNLRSPMFKDSNGNIPIGAILDSEHLYQRYPWILDNVTVKLVHSIPDGSELKIVTLGGGEGVIHISEPYWGDALKNLKDDNHRNFLAKALVHEIGHAVDDKEGNFETDTPDEINRAEKFANDFMNKWY